MPTKIINFRQSTQQLICLKEWETFAPNFLWATKSSRICPKTRFYSSPKFGWISKTFRNETAFRLHKNSKWNREWLWKARALNRTNFRSSPSKWKPAREKLTFICGRFMNFFKDTVLRNLLSSFLPSPFMKAFAKPKKLRARILPAFTKTTHSIWFLTTAAASIVSAVLRPPIRRKWCWWRLMPSTKSVTIFTNKPTRFKAAISNRSSSFKKRARLLFWTNRKALIIPKKPKPRFAHWSRFLLYVIRQLTAAVRILFIVLLRLKRITKALSKKSK